MRPTELKLKEQRPIRKQVQHQQFYIIYIKYQYHIFCGVFSQGSVIPHTSVVPPEGLGLVLGVTDQEILE